MTYTGLWPHENSMCVVSVKSVDKSTSERVCNAESSMRIIVLLLMHFQHVKARCMIKRLKAHWHELSHFNWHSWVVYKKFAWNVRQVGADPCLGIFRRNSDASRSLKMPVRQIQLAIILPFCESFSLFGASIRISETLCFSHISNL